MMRMAERVIACALAGACLAMNATAEGFRLGADIGWVTEIEHGGGVFKTVDGAPRDLYALLKDYGVDAVRLRVWVNPRNGWNGKADTLVKAKRAVAAGMDVMIDYHYSDFWADPGKQEMPAAWRGHDLLTVCGDLAAHTKDVLQCLKDNGVSPKWVQVGNETTYGFLWTPKRDEKGHSKWVDLGPGKGWAVEVESSLAHIVYNPENYAKLFKAGYDAVKSVFPKTIVIVHIDQAHKPELTDRNLETLRKYGATWDMVGFSLYPYHARPKEVKGDPAKIVPFDAQVVTDGIANIVRTAKRWECPTMIVETGAETRPVAPLTTDYSRALIERIIREARANTQGLCRGVFYWEPACRPSVYPLGAFTEDLRPTQIMEAFRTGRSGDFKPNIHE